ncbi:MAG: non-heme iron oxygenase ferredoxin subunit [Candidatus Phosphoribacter sp.]
MSDASTEIDTLDPVAGFTRVCGLEDLAVGTPALAEVDGIRMALVRVSHEEVHAVQDTCTHANVSLSEGELDGCTLECWLHGSRFDLRTGVPSCPPALTPIAVYPVQLVAGAVFVSTTPAADSQLVPKEH